MESTSNGEIIRRVVEGDTNAFEHFLNRYQNHVLMIVKRHVPHDQVEETAQEVFIRVFQSLEGFKNKGNFKEWISAIAVRTCYDYWRKKYRSREISLSELSVEHRNWLDKALFDESSRFWNEETTRNEATEILDWALDQLSPEDRMVTELVYLEGLSGKEAAELLGWSLANVKVRAFRSRKKLHNLLLKGRRT